jgi:proline iminopeptidase
MRKYIERLIRLGMSSILIAACTDQHKAEAPAHPSEGYIESHDGVALYWRLLGAAGDTVIVLHGGPFVDHSYWVPDLEPLAETHVLIFYDQRGTGRSTLVSDPASLQLEAHIADLEAVRQHFGLSRMAVLGHSWGPLLGAGYALEHSEKLSALIAVSPAPLRREPYWDQVLPRVTAWMDSTTLMELGARDAARRDTTHDPHAACRALFELYVRGALADPTDVAMARRIAAGFCSAPAAAIRNQMLVDSLTIGSLGDFDWRERFHESRFPVLVVAGEKDVDPVEAYQEWLLAFPNARLNVLEGAGHFSYLERPDEFFSVVVEFLHEHSRVGVREATGDSG